VQDEELVKKAIESCKNNELSFCKFISANDSGETGGHQSGIYIPHNSFSILFETPGIKGHNKDKFIEIRWQDDDNTVTDSRFIYYGKRTRNEYRITRFGKGFSLLDEQSTGNLFVFVKLNDNNYDAYMFSADEDIETFLAAFGMSAADTNTLIQTSNIVRDREDVIMLFEEFIRTLEKDFPSTGDIARKAREIYQKANQKDNKKESIKTPDKVILKWIDTEYRLFKAIENHFYGDYVYKPFGTVDALVMAANTILNRRKSRAGKSLEHHLRQVFDFNELRYSYQKITESNKTPDFIFPGISYYFESKYKKNLVFLASKTTCKDRWRQILNEADRIKTKHLFTLQQGISKNQLDEMYKYNVVLVTPKEYISSFPGEYKEKILPLNGFIEFTRGKTEI